MQRPVTSHPSDFAGATVVITRPAGTAASLARRVQALGGVPLLLPGLALRGVVDQQAAQASLHAALADEIMVFTSPAAVRYAAALQPLRTSATVLAVGQGTARALRRHGVAAPLAPQQQDSEGVLQLEPVRQLRGKRVALIGAPGGRGVLRRELAARGAQLREVHVYHRVPPRLDRRHFDALRGLSGSTQILLSSAEALSNLQQGLPSAAWQQLCAAMAVVSSDRLAAAAQAAGFQRIVIAPSAFADDLLKAALRAD